MTPEQKAKELVEKYTNAIWESGNTVSKPMIKQCALIAVELILEGNNLLRLPLKYWQQVKTEIQKL